ncbi:hypothetical protein [Mycolicibacterium porcinum]|uniref:hypothetical protein n=1 Tax=Mycolicibacterium porcinum TaxID=39693 RepID=UPI0008492E3D|nr:hypothetical protein [Mycolicibacterium porcinum]ODR25795.1 hypothetical protein BHQ19_10205 [Mycolicibacterium porcinum]
MTLDNITYKEILDAEGNFKALEIWQGIDHVTVTLRTNQFGDSTTNWQTIKDTVDRIAERVHRDSEVRA